MLSTDKELRSLILETIGYDELDFRPDAQLVYAVQEWMSQFPTGTRELELVDIYSKKIHDLSAYEIYNELAFNSKCGWCYTIAVFARKVFSLLGCEAMLYAFGALSFTHAVNIVAVPSHKKEDYEFYFFDAYLNISYTSPGYAQNDYAAFHLALVEEKYKSITPIFHPTDKTYIEKKNEYEITENIRLDWHKLFLYHTMLQISKDSKAIETYSDFEKMVQLFPFELYHYGFSTEKLNTEVLNLMAQYQRTAYPRWVEKRNEE